MSGSVMAGPGDSLFSKSNRLRYVDHLVRTGKFAEAGREWHSIWVLSGKDSHALYAVRYFGFAGLPDSVLYYDSATGQLPGAGRMRLFALAMKGSFSGAGSLDRTDSFRLALTSACISRNIREAKRLCSVYQRKRWLPVNDPELETLLRRLKKTRNIPVGMCVASSALLPGSGRFMTGRNMDAFLSFSVTLTNTMLAFYTYRELGARSVWPWFYGSIAAGFYTANIYGTLRDSRGEYTHRQKLLSHEAYHYLHHRLLLER